MRTDKVCSYPNQDKLISAHWGHFLNDFIAVIYLALRTILWMNIFTKNLVHIKIFEGMQATYTWDVWATCWYGLYGMSFFYRFRVWDGTQRKNMAKHTSFSLFQQRQQQQHPGYHHNIIIHNMWLPSHTVIWYSKRMRRLQRAYPNAKEKVKR